MTEWSNRWSIAALGDVCDLYQPKTISTRDLVPDGKYAVYGANGEIGRYTSYNEAEPQVLITCRGATCGTINVSKPLSWVNGNAMVARPRNGLLNRGFLKLVLQQCDFTKVITGSAQPQITRQNLAPLRIPVPPIDEQLRIVATIEENFSHLDAADKSLRSAAARLPSLLVAIHAKLSGQVAETVPLSSIADVRLGRQRSPKDHFGPNMKPYLRAANVTWDGLMLADVKEMNFSERETGIFRLMTNDILVVEASGSRYEVGKIAVWRDDLPECYFQNTLIRVRASEKVRPQYLALVLKYAAISGALGRAANGVGIHHLGRAGLISWPIPLPDTAEQERITQEIAALETSIETVQRSIRNAKKRAQAVRDAVLTQAFSTAGG